MDKFWVGIGVDGRIVNGGHNRPRLYDKDRDTAIKWASRDDRIVAVVEFNAGEIIWSRPPRGN